MSEIIENENPVDAGSGEKELTVAKSFEILESLVKKLESEETGLEESFALYQEGMRILKDVSMKIDTYEKKMQILYDNGEVGEFT